jgi:hypothetical protein
MRVILVPVADRPECAIALDTAFGLAQQHGANVVGCHIRPHRDEDDTGVLTEGPNSWIEEDGGVDGEGANLGSKAARDLFTRTAEKYGYTLAKRPKQGKNNLALWYEMVGTPAKVMSIVGPVSDLIVVSRPKQRSAGRAKAFLLGALLHSSRPVLILPQKAVNKPSQRIVVAWNQSADAAAVMRASMPLLQQAEQVTLFTSGPENLPGPKSTYALDYLLHWGVKAERMSAKGRNHEQEIEAVMKASKSHLLVMGAYSRSRLRQLLFGGVTEHMLFKTELPVLMLHR